jgi:PAS domain S-box-containing protein
MACILLMIESREDRRIFREHLDAQHAVVEAAPDAALDEPFDLCILDGLTLQRIRERIDLRRVQEAPRFLPFLLVTARDDVARTPDDLWQRIDDILVSPIDGRELTNRVRVLLRAREASEQLDAERQTLQESESLFRSLAENANAIVGIIQGTHFVYANPYLSSLSGYSRDELLTMPIGDFVVPEYRDLVVQNAARRQAGDTSLPTRYDFAILTKDGRERMLDYTAALTSYHGRPAIVGIAYDITERKRAEIALRDSEARYYAFSEASTEGIAIHDQGIILEVNKVIAEHLGYTQEEMVGQSLLKYVAPESHPEVIRHMQAGDPGPYEATSLHRDGTKTIGEMRARNFVYHNREIRMVAMRDITEQKRAEAERERLLAQVQRQTAELEATIFGITDGLIVYNQQGDIVRMNDPARKLFGFTEAAYRESFAVRWARRHVTTQEGESIPTGELPTFRALQGERVQGVLLKVTSPSTGQTRALSVSAGPIFTPDGQVRGAVTIYTDITALQHLQEQQKALLQMVSHDLRAPLSIIKGHTQVVVDLLDNQHLNGMLQQSMTAIDRGVDRMNAMIQDLVDVTRWEGGQLELKRETIDVPWYIDDLLQRIGTAMEISRIQVELQDNLPPISADYAGLERILINLLSNALKYSDPGTPIRMQAWQENDEVLFTVADQGRGIPPEDQPHLFERFYRAAGTRKAEGIGLGLYITRVLVEAHGGRIWFESEVGKGSTFYFTLPAAQ